MFQCRCRPARNAVQADGGQSARAITPRTKLLILPYPNNPTGAIMTRDEQAIATVIKDTNIIVLSDEIYNS